MYFTLSLFLAKLTDNFFEKKLKKTFSKLTVKFEK